MSPADPIRIAPLALWRVAEAFLRALNALFGPPERVAFLHTLTAKNHKLMSGWLRAGEALMRRLLAIEAAAYPKPNTRPLLTRARQREKKLMAFSEDAPHLWRVSFRCFDRPCRPKPARAVAMPAVEARGEPVFVFREDRTPRAERLAPPRRSAHRARHQPQPRVRRQDRLWVQYEPSLRFRSAWPLAERFEALQRVFNDPAPYARRLARRLHATPHRLVETLRAPPDTAGRVEHFDEMEESAVTHWRAHFSSG